MSELLERGLSTVAVVVGSDESAITAQNTMNTLKSLEGVSRRTQRPVVMYYDHNQRGSRRSDIDSSLISAITALSALASKQNDEMDTKDISNWLEYHKTSPVKAQLSVLNIHTAVDKVQSVKNPISIASLYGSPDEETITATPDYHTVGYTGKDSDVPNSLHFIISVDAINSVYQMIQATLDQLDEIRNSRVDHGSVLKDTDSVDDNGMVY